MGLAMGHFDSGVACSMGPVLYVACTWYAQVSTFHSLVVGEQSCLVLRGSYLCLESGFREHACRHNNVKQRFAKHANIMQRHIRGA